MMENTTVVAETNTNAGLSPAAMLELPSNYGERLTPAMRQQVQNLAANINITNGDFVTNYGSEQQTSLGKFADSMLNGRGSQEIGETGLLLNQAMNQINNYDSGCDGESKGFLGKIFGSNPMKRMQQIRDSYKSVDKKIEIIVKELASKQMQVAKVYDDFDALFDANKETYEYLTTIIYAGELAEKEAQEKLAIMQQDPNTDPQDIRDFSDQLDRFNKRLYDLKMTRAIAISLAPQIRSVQKSALQVKDSIHTAINTSIPLWKTQMALALGIQTVQAGLDASNQVNDVTNQMFLRVSQAGKDLAIESAKASQRGVLDIDTVRQVNQNLVESLTESTRIVQEGIEKRKQDERELKQLETDLATAIRTIK